MNKEESFQRKIWWFLDAIKDWAVLGKPGDPIAYWRPIPHIHAGGIIDYLDAMSMDDKRIFLNLLEEMGAIERNRPGTTGAVLYLKQPKFDEVYGHYQKKYGLYGKDIYVDYDEKNATLTFGDKKIKITKTNQTHPALLMTLLAKDIHKTWHKDEIYDALGYELEEQSKISKQRLYQASLKINSAVKEETQKDDFLIFEMDNVQINPKYLEN